MLTNYISKKQAIKSENIEIIVNKNVVDEIIFQVLHDG